MRFSRRKERRESMSKQEWFVLFIFLMSIIMGILS